MTEIITESFCERCGTRYTFEAAIPKKRRIGKLRVLSKGLKNYVLSDDASLDEALAEARSDEQRELTGGQLDAFHQTFQFCMSCRQYTCANCWNEPEGRCLSCAPMVIGGSQTRSAFDDLLAGGGMSPLVPPPAPEPTWAGALPAVETNAQVGPGGPSAFVTPAAAMASAAAFAPAEAAVPEAPTQDPVPAAVVAAAWPTIDLFRSPEPVAEPAAEATTEPASEAVEAEAVEAEAVEASEAVPRLVPRLVPKRPSPSGSRRSCPRPPRTGCVPSATSARPKPRMATATATTSRPRPRPRPWPKPPASKSPSPVPSPSRSPLPSRRSSRVPSSSRSLSASRRSSRVPSSSRLPSPRRSRSPSPRPRRSRTNP